jgi:hypothetical protein
MALISRMIVELANDISHLRQKVKGPQTKEWSCLSQLHKKDDVRWCWEGSGRGANVFHGPKEATLNLLISIRYKSFLERTNLQFPRDEHYMQCYGSWMDLVARAIYEDPVVIDSL